MYTHPARIKASCPELLDLFIQAPLFTPPSINPLAEIDSSRPINDSSSGRYVRICMMKAVLIIAIIITIVIIIIIAITFIITTVTIVTIVIIIITIITVMIDSSSSSSSRSINTPAAMASLFSVPYLGKLPMDPNMMYACENGFSFLEKFPLSPAAGPFSAIVDGLIAATPDPAPESMDTTV